MRITGLILLGSLAAVQQQGAYKPVATNAQLMTTLIIPSSDAIFDVSVNPPKTDEAWANLENQSLILAESGNLLMMDGRAVAETLWMEESRGLVDSGEDAFKAAKAKDLKRMLEVGEDILATCARCHYQYLK